MKFSTNILTLLVATTAAFSRNVPVKRDDYDKCLSDLKDNSDCFDILMTKMTNKNFDEICKIYSSEKCQKLYSEVDKIPESCFDTKNEKTGLTRDGVRQLVAQYKYMCVKDEKDRLCPLPDISINHFYNPKFSGTKEEVDRDSFKAIEETCYSKKCTDALVEYDITMLNDQKILEMMSTHSNGESIEDFKKYFEDGHNLLTSKNCTEKAGTKTPELYSDSHKDSTSDGCITYIKMSSMIMITLSVLYYLL
ncbi:hypothetical protein H8356DRAFT_143206 [Neocallimastix lanati (nom. inval.)]|nr:hypothetical protein H8356DRAFT_143206 [Neocallimastix sp. JGI-2020a]